MIVFTMFLWGNIWTATIVAHLKFDKLTTIEYRWMNGLYARIT